MMTIEVKTRFVGYHRYANAPEEVKFLRNLHRHVFWVEVEVEVAHDDREKEFFIIQDRLNKFINTDTPEEVGSCEHIARRIAMFMEGVVRVKVSEDGENAAIFYPLK